MHVLAALLGQDQAGLPQQIEMVGDAGQAHGKMLADLRDRQVALAQQLEDAAAGGVIQRAEQLGHVVR